MDYSTLYSKNNIWLGSGITPVFEQFSEEALSFAIRTEEENLKQNLIDFHFGGGYPLSRVMRAGSKQEAAALVAHNLFEAMRVHGDNNRMSYLWLAVKAAKLYDNRGGVNGVTRVLGLAGV